MSPPPAGPVFDAGFRAQLEDLLRWRRDVRHFSTQPVAEEDMQALLALAALAPSVGNSQPWRFVRVRSADLRAQLAAHADAQSQLAAQTYADPAQRAHYLSLKLHGLREAPEVLAVYCDEAPVAGHRLGIATMPEMLRYSCVMAVQTLWLAARARGIGLGWVSIIAPATVDALLAVPAGWHLVALLCLGYPEAPALTPELEQCGWQAREPLTDRIIER